VTGFGAKRSAANVQNAVWAVGLLALAATGERRRGK
jgi:hypothetical protein